MNGRGFLTGLGALIGGITLEQAIPLGRVWSFPKAITCLNVEPIIYPPHLAWLATVYYDRLALEMLERRLRFTAIAAHKPLPHIEGKLVGFVGYAA